MAVIDDALAKTWKFYFPKKDLNRVLTLQATAPRFVFTQSASRLAGQFAHDCPDLVLNNRQFAVPPYPQMYIEFHSQSFMEGSPYAKTNEAYYDEMGMPPDQNVGYLLDGPWVYTFVTNGVDPPGPSLLKIKLVRPGEAAGLDQIRLVASHEDSPVGSAKPAYFADDDKVSNADWTRMVAILGGAVAALQSEDQRQQILSEVSYHWLGPPLAKNHSLGNTYLKALQGGAGEIRNLWTLLLWLNQPARVRFVDVPATRRIVGGKLRAYRQHKSVDIELGKSITIRRALKFEDRESPINHPVRGAFHHSGGNPACTHEWPLWPDDKSHWYCVKCNRMRWWTKGHRRGDATKGFSDTQYNVKLAEKPPGWPDTAPKP